VHGKMGGLQLENTKDYSDHYRTRMYASGEPERLKVNARVGSCAFITIQLSGTMRLSEN
jgi:hypothetical protein